MEKHVIMIVTLVTMIRCINGGWPRPVPWGLYVFGDSLFDSGNNNLLPTLARADFSPYGVNFPKGVTGRFTNGKTVADFIAEYLGLPHTRPYLAIRGSSDLTGLNYASGSCGILSETGNDFGKCLNLNDQVKMFEITAKTELYFKLGIELSTHLKKSIFIFSIGNNDYINNYLDSSTTRQQYNPESFAQRLVDRLALQFEKLYDVGARKVLMFELGPIGCLPSVTKKRNGGTECVEEVNEMISYFNQRLGPMLNNLTSTLPGSTFSLGHAHWLGYDAIQNPFKYGLTDVRNPCCESLFNGTSGCIPLSKSCNDPTKNFFWDAFHLTEPVCSLIAGRCFSDPSVCSPTLSQLAQL